MTSAEEGNCAACGSPRRHGHCPACREAVRQARKRLDAATEVTAASLIRASIAALPEHQREPWEYRATSLYMDGTSHGSVVAVPHAGPSPVSAVSGSAGEHIALLASPDVAVALADLLDAITYHEDFMADYEAVTEARDALEAALMRGSS